MKRVCHISPVHDMADNRIFYRECRSLADAGYLVAWVVQHEQDDVVAGVQVLALRRTGSKIWRWLFAGWEALYRTVRWEADICHFHDPEFIPYALLLRLLGKQVVYDIHEDYVSAISQKFYIPKFLRRPLSRLFGKLEVTVAGCFHQVIAERYYSERFPNATPVLNYPVIEKQTACGRSETALLYTGKVHLYRGAMIHAQIPSLVPGTTVSFVGRCAPELHRDVVANNQPHLDQLSFVGVGQNVPFMDIVKQYREGSWLAGLAIFPPNEHLDRKELTKFFEYMTYGLPIVASNFPVWRQLVEDNGCGICVDPNDSGQIVDAIHRLQDEKFWNEMSANGMRTVREKFSWKSQESNLLGLYQSLGDSHGRKS